MRVVGGISPRLGGGGGGSSGSPLAYGTVSGVANLDIVLVPWMSQYRAFRVLLTNFVPANSVVLKIQVSSDGGSSFSSAANYRHGTFGAYYAGAPSWGAVSAAVGGTYWQISDDFSSSYSQNLELWLPDPNNASAYPQAWWQGTAYKNSSGGIGLWGTGDYASAQITNALRFQMWSGNLSTKWALVGDKNA